MFDNPVEETYSAEDAQVVFAAVMDHPELLAVLNAALDPQDFNPMGERPLWLAMNALVRQGQQLTPEALAMRLARYGDFSAAIAALPGLDLLADRPPAGVSRAELSRAVSALRRRSRERQVVALLTELVEIGLARQDRPDRAIAAIHARAAAALADSRFAPPLGGSAPDGARGGLLSARALVADQAGAGQPLWLVDKLLPAGGVSLLAGEVASGKTFLALDLAISSAAGLPAWGGRACLPGPVLYCCLDSSPRTIRARVQALCAGRGIDPPENLFFDFSPLNLAQASGQERFRRMVQKTRASLVVLDVLARYLPGVDENAVAGVGPVFSMLRGLAAESGASFPASPTRHHPDGGTGSALLLEEHASREHGRTLPVPPLWQGLGVLVVHHLNKSTSALGMQRVRGSSDIVAAVDAALSVTLSGSRERPRRTVTPEKNRELPEEPAFDFTLEPGPGAGLRLSFSAPQVPLLTVREALPAAFDRALEILRAAPQALTRLQIEERLAPPQGQPGLSPYLLNRLFSMLAETESVEVRRAGLFKTYRWLGDGPLPGREYG